MAGCRWVWREVGEGAWARHPSLVGWGLSHFPCWPRGGSTDTCRWQCEKGCRLQGRAWPFIKVDCLCTQSVAHVDYGYSGLAQATELEGRCGDGNWGPWVEIESPLLPPLAEPQGLSLSHLESCPLNTLATHWYRSGFASVLGVSCL